MYPPTVTSERPAHGRRVILRVELLSDRTLPSATLTEPVLPVVMAGDLNGSPTDSPDQRIDPNTIDSPYAGVGSILVTTRRTTFLGTGAAIDSRHILTAAHVVDLNNDGKVDARDGTTGVYFLLNFGGDGTQKIAVSDFAIEPTYTGFNRPSVNDDIAVLTLAEDLPEGVPIYQLANSDLAAGTVITMVGYGRSGNGMKGYTTVASPFVKRVGLNTVDAFYGQDDKGLPERDEVFRFDFDGPTGNGPLGEGTLGNNLESQLGMGDSGGPAFMAGPDGSLVIAGVTTFVQGRYIPRFGSMGGGVIVFPYLRFIHSVMTPDTTDITNPDELRISTDFIPILGPAIIPSRGGAGIRVGAWAISGEFAVAHSGPGSAGAGSSGTLTGWGNLSVGRSDDSRSRTDDSTSTTAVDDTPFRFTLQTVSPSWQRADSAVDDSLLSVDLGLLGLVSGDGILSDE